MGGQLVVPWTLVLTSGEVLDDIKWFFTGHTQTKQMIAVSSNGTFLTVPAYFARLRAYNASGLELSHVTAEDAGTYTMEIEVEDGAGNVTTTQTSVHVEVGEGLQTTDGGLHVAYSPTAVQDSAGHWSVQLHCGTFTYLSSAPFDVQWTFPSGRTVNGSSYQDGHFILELSAPVEGGNYTCRVPQESWQAACLHGNQDKAQSTLYVDGTEVRLMLLEAHQAALQKQNDFLKAENSQLRNNLTQLQSVQASPEPHVNFHAMGLQSSSQTPGARFILPHVTANEGTAYNSSTGDFTAPYGGAYFFAASTGSHTMVASASFELVVEGSRVAYGQTYSQSSEETTSIQAVVHLTAGQRVWLNALDAVDYASNVTSFSGFLLHSD